jgi:hypothetical protein
MQRGMPQFPSFRGGCSEPSDSSNLASSRAAAGKLDGSKMRFPVQFPSVSIGKKGRGVEQ